MLLQFALFLCLFTWASAAEIVAHRGASHDAPENSLSSMKLAWDQGSDAIELDLHLSKDGKIVVIHDKDTKRVAQKPEPVAEQLFQDLQKLEIGSWKFPTYRGEKIPTLESILETIPKGKRAYLEIKCGPEILPELKRVLSASGTPAKRLVIICFDFKTLQKSKREFPKIDHYYLHDFKKKDPPETHPKLETVLAQAKEGNFQGLDLHQDWPIDRAFVREVKKHGLKLAVWTVNDPDVARKMVQAGVDGITTDRPGWIREQLRKEK